MTSTLARLADLLERLVGALESQPLRGLGPEDLLTREEVARYLRCHVTDAGRWLDDDGHGRPRVPRALSPGRRGTTLYRVADVRLALDTTRATQQQRSIRESLGAH